MSTLNKFHKWGEPPAKRECGRPKRVAVPVAPQDLNRPQLDGVKLPPHAIVRKLMRGQYAEDCAMTGVDNPECRAYTVPGMGTFYIGPNGWLFEEEEK